MTSRADGAGPGAGAARPQPAPSPSFIIALDGPAVKRVAAALQQAGEGVTLAAGMAELTSAARAGAPAVVLLDLSGKSPAGKAPGRGGAPGRGAGAAGSTGDAAEQAPLAPSPGPPFVVALTREGRPAEAPPLAVDLCLPADDIPRAVREVQGALAMRRVAGLTAELEQLRAAVKHARRTAHDLAQPLTTIMARAQLLAGRLKPDDPSARPIGIICEESEKLARLIEQFQKLRELTASPSSRQD